MLSGVNEYDYNLEPLGIFCLRVTFYFTAETRPGQPISTCGRAGDVIQNVLRLSLARGRRCGRATPVNSEQPTHTFSPKRTICIILHPNALFMNIVRKTHIIINTSLVVTVLPSVCVVIANAD